MKNKIKIHFLLSASIILFFIGIFAPMATFKKFFIFNNTYSLLSATIDLLIEKEYFLFIIIFAFSILFPLLKFFLLYKINFISGNNHSNHNLKLLETFGKWSMLDVFVIAFMLMTIKLGAIAKIEVHIGIYAFALSVIFTMLTTYATKQSKTD